MRSLLVWGAVVLGISVVGSSQSQPAKSPKPRPSTEFKVKEGVTEGKSSQGLVPRPQGAPAAKNLQNVERQRVKRTPSSAPKKLPAAAVQPEKNRPTPKIDFKGNGEGKGKGLAGPAQDPYKGRLREKGPH